MNPYLKEESKILIADIDIGVGSQRTLLFRRLASAAVSVLVHLGQDLLGCVEHEDGRGCDRCRHLGARSLQGVEEPRMDERGLRVLQALADVSGQAEVGVF